MQYGSVVGIDRPLSRIVQGTTHFGASNIDEAFEVYDAVFEMGCNVFDTAHGYHSGQSEVVLGKWIASRGIRDKVAILDKGAHPYNKQKRVKPEFITADLNESLERMGVDYVDLYVLHRDDPDVPVEPLIDILNEHVKDGKIKALGASNWTHERIELANQYAQQNGLKPFVVSSPQFSLAEMVKPAWPDCISIGADEDAMKWYQENPVVVMTWSSLAGGFMTGKFRRDNTNTFDYYFDEVAVNAYCYEDNFKRLDRAEALAAHKGVALVQLALAYVLSHPVGAFALVGNRSRKEVEMNCGAFDVNLSRAECAWLNLETDQQPFQ